MLKIRHINNRILIGLSVFIFLFLTGCDAPEPPAESSYIAVDELAQEVRANIDGTPDLQWELEIDHARLGEAAGSPMPPARVMIFSAAPLETILLAENRLIGIDLPLRILAYESVGDGQASLIFNTFDYLASRYALAPNPALAQAYLRAYETALEGLDSGVRRDFADNTMQPNQIVSIQSAFDFETSLARVNAAINAQGDTVSFGEIDFQSRAERQGVALPPTTLILFGGPGPGGKAMANAPTLGLDAFCQKFLLWEDDNGQVHLSFNDLLGIAERQQVPKSPALRVVNHRLVSVFSEALEP